MVNSYLCEFLLCKFFKLARVSVEKGNFSRIGFPKVLALVE